MSLRNAAISNETRLAVVQELIGKQHAAVRRGEPGAEARLRVLKSLAIELRSRIERGPTTVLTVLEDQLDRLLQIKGPHTNEPTQLAALGMLIVQNWPAIRTAIETYREPTHEQNTGISP